MIYCCILTVYNTLYKYMVCAGLNICQIIKGISEKKPQITVSNTELFTLFGFVFLKRQY